ncbi:MAG: DUF4178 domain-containing protein [Planctomycetota bacterium]|jgi:hypothetical protein
MSGRTANCPNCAGPIEFKNAATLYVVCPYCGGASQRQDVDLHFLGKVAAVADIDSPFDLGARGDFNGLGWTIVGQLQLDHGAGPWNEWCAVFDDGSWRWIAEAQGKVYLTRELDLESPDLEIPPHGFLQPGEPLSLGEAGDFVVAETGQGEVVAARGELPVLIITGAKVNYTDLSGGDDRFATLDYGDGTTCLAAYAGERHDFHDLGFHPESVGRKEAKRVDVDRLGCASCGAPLQVRDPECKRIGCQACGCLMDAGTQQVVAEQGKSSRAPLIALGSPVTLRGAQYTLLAYLIRSVTSYGTRYPWAEYLLRNNADGSYRWLIHQNGHWNLAVPVELGDCRKASATSSYKGRSFKHFTSGTAVVEYVLGEVYWAVEQGEAVQADDFVAPPEMLSFESSRRDRGAETVASLTTYLPHTEVQLAFKLKKVAKPRGVAPNQPNPHAIAPWLPWWLGMVALIIVMIVGFHASFEQRDLVLMSGNFAAGAPPAKPEVVFSKEFDITASRGNVQIKLESQGGAGNYWVGFDGALANTITGDVHVFGVSGERWHGVTGGESWSEGSGGGTVYVGSVPAGTYALRLERQREPIRAGDVNWTVRAKSQVPSIIRPLLLLVLLSLVPVIVLIRRGAFETQRWAESDHAG